MGPDAPDHGAWPPGRCDAGDQRGRLRALGPEGALAEPARAPPARRADATVHPGLCQHARLRGARPGRGAGAGTGIQGARLHGAEMVLPSRPDERPGRAAAERRPGPHPTRDARRRVRHHARLLAVDGSDLCDRARGTHRGIPPALARGGGDAGPHRQLPPRQGAHATSRSPAPSTNTRAGDSSASSTRTRSTCCSPTSIGAAGCRRR